MKTNNNLLTYFLSRALFLGGGMSTIFLFSGKDSYISVFLGILIGVAIIFILSKIGEKIKLPFKEYLKVKKQLNILIKFIYFIYIIFIIFIMLIILSTFLYSYFLPFTPSFISCLPFVFLATFLNSKNIKNIYYVALSLLIISLFIVILKTTLLANEMEFNNLLPFLTTKPISIFKGSLVYATLSTAPYLLIIDENIEFKKSIKYYLLAGIVNLIVVTTIVSVLGEMVNVYSYPEYSVLRKIRLFDFIENIENFISAAWFFDLFIVLSLAGLKIKDILNIKNRLVPLGLTTLILVIVSLFISDNFYNSMIIYKIFPILFACFLLILIILMFIKIKLSKNQHHN